MIPLHQRLTAIAYELQQRGDTEAATWIQKHVAQEQKAKKRRPKRRGKRVRIGPRQLPAWLSLTVVNQAIRDEEREADGNED